jgi:hypothetical protein
MTRPKRSIRLGTRARRKLRQRKAAKVAQRQLRGQMRTGARRAKAEEVAAVERRIDRMCRSKKRYATEESANAAAIDTGKYVYKCHPPADCGGWHVTSKALDRAPRPRKAGDDVASAT